MCIRDRYTINQQKISPDDIYQYVSVCAPYLELIEEMTLSEFLSYHASFKPQKMEVNEIIAYIGLEKSKDKLIEKYSSGMKQRVKLAQAFISNAPVLLLLSLIHISEPTRPY